MQLPTIPATVLDPFAGSGTTLAVAAKLGRYAIGIELNPQYCLMARDRIDQELMKSGVEHVTTPIIPAGSSL